MSSNLEHFMPAFAFLCAMALMLVVAVLLRQRGRRLRERSWFEVEELKRRTDVGGDLLVVDVRASEDFIGEQGHLSFACNLPLEELEARLGELGDDPRRSIAIVCRTDRRSAKAEVLLAKKGFADVHVVRGGMTAWLARGWSVERSAR